MGLRYEFQFNTICLSVPAPIKARIKAILGVEPLHLELTGNSTWSVIACDTEGNWYRVYRGQKGYTSGSYEWQKIIIDPEDK